MTADWPLRLLAACAWRWANVQSVKVFGADGQRRRQKYTLESAELAIAHKDALAQRNRHGLIVTLHLYGDSRNPLPTRLKAGTRYSHREQVGNRKRWTLERLPIYPVTDAITTEDFYAELTRKQASPFLAVPLSCIRKAPVITINSKHPRRMKDTLQKAA